MNNLYIIGNGFDLHHRIKSSYNDYKNWLINHNFDLYDTLEHFYADKSNCDLWSDFEFNLGLFDVTNITLQYTAENFPNLASDDFRDRDWYLSEHKISADLSSMVSNLESSFKGWIQSLNPPDKICKLIISANSFFINFNYTLTLEKLYNILPQNILHIHGSILDDNYVIGHNMSLKELERIHNPGSDDIVFNPTREECIRHVVSLKKDVKGIIKKNEAIFSRLQDIQQIYVYGFSFSKIDLPYIHMIQQYCPKACWEISYYSQDEKLKLSNIIKSLKLDLSKCTFIMLNEKLYTKQLTLNL